MLRLEIYDRIGTVFSYDIMYENPAIFLGETEEEYYKWIEDTNFTEVEKVALEDRVSFALGLQYPRHFYRFINDE